MDFKKGQKMKKKKKGIAKKIAVVLLTLLTVFPCFRGFAYAENRGGSFYLTVCTEEETLLEPVSVQYDAGQSVNSALLGSG